MLFLVLRYNEPDSYCPEYDPVYIFGDLEFPLENFVLIVIAFLCFSWFFDTMSPIPTAPSTIQCIYLVI